MKIQVVHFQDLDTDELDIMILSVRELVDGEWEDIDINAHIESDQEQDELFLYQDDDGFVWSDEGDFVAGAEVDEEGVPTPENAVEVWEAFSAYVDEVYGDDEDMRPVETLVFIVTVENESEDEA